MLELGGDVAVGVDRDVRHDLHKKAGCLPMTDELEAVDGSEGHCTVLVNGFVEVPSPDSGTRIHVPKLVLKLRALGLEVERSRNPIVVLGKRHEDVEITGGMSQVLPANILKHEPCNRYLDVLLYPCQCYPW